MAKHTILVVEDDLSIQALLKILLKSQGYTVFTAENGTKALQICHEIVPAIVLLDVNLPDMDGYAIGKALRSDSKTKDVPLVFVTARTEKADRLKALGDVGAEYYLSKPFDMDELQAVVEQVIAGSRERHFAHPLTGLPSAELVNDELRKLIGSQYWALALAQIDGFPGFIAARGTQHGEQLLRATAVALIDALEASDAPGTFVGQLSTSAEFVVISTPERIEAILEEFLARFQATAGNLIAADPTGACAPPVALSIGVLTDANGPFDDIRELTGAAETARAANQHRVTHS